MSAFSVAIPKPEEIILNEPCAFIHYSDSNIRTHTLIEAYKRPLFMQYRRMRGQITAGLVRRRIAESILFVTPDNTTLNVPEIVDAIEKYQPAT